MSTKPKKSAKDEPSSVADAPNPYEPQYDATATKADESGTGEKVETKPAADVPEGYSNRDEAAELMGSLLEQFSEITKQNRILLAKVEALEKAKEQGGIQDPKWGGRRVAGGPEPTTTIIREAEPDPAEYAVFRSPFPGLRQVVRKGDTQRHPNGDVTFDPPLVAEFSRGVCVVYDEEMIELLRKKMAEKKRKGIVDFIEVTDPALKKVAMKGTTHITSRAGITPDTPLDALIT